MSRTKVTARKTLQEQTRKPYRYRALTESGDEQDDDQLEEHTPQHRAQSEDITQRQKAQDGSSEAPSLSQVLFPQHENRTEPMQAFPSGDHDHESCSVDSADDCLSLPEGVPASRNRMVVDSPSEETDSNAQEDEDRHHPSGPDASVTDSQNNATGTSSQTPEDIDFDQSDEMGNKEEAVRPAEQKKRKVGDGGKEENGDLTESKRSKVDTEQQVLGNKNKESVRSPISGEEKEATAECNNQQNPPIEQAKELDFSSGSFLDFDTLPGSPIQSFDQDILGEEYDQMTDEHDEKMRGESHAHLKLTCFTVLSSIKVNYALNYDFLPQLSTRIRCRCSPS